MIPWDCGTDVDDESGPTEHSQLSIPTELSMTKPRPQPVNQPVSLDENAIIKEVGASVRHVFFTTLALPVTIGSALMDEPAGEVCESVLSLIGWSGTWKGTGMLSCSPQLACKIASLMLGTEYASLCPDVLDAVGEMANMIFGNVKTNLEAVLGAMDLSIPTVLYGNSLSVRSMVRKAIIIPVIAEGHTLMVKVHMEPDTKHAMRAARLCVNIDLADVSPLNSF
jgi:chemotaxis protein CheX